jgi:hypothetical protein
MEGVRCSAVLLRGAGRHSADGAARETDGAASETGGQVGARGKNSFDQLCLLIPPSVRLKWVY